VEYKSGYVTSFHSGELALVDLNDNEIVTGSTYIPPKPISELLIYDVNRKFSSYFLRPHGLANMNSNNSYYKLDQDIFKLYINDNHLSAYRIWNMRYDPNTNVCSLVTPGGRRGFSRDESSSGATVFKATSNFWNSHTLLWEGKVLFTFNIPN
jgi:hypothetical protein